MFRMNVDSGESDGLVIVSLRGELDLVDAAMVAAGLRSLAARDRWIIVDLSGLEFIDAAGAAALSRGRRQARNAGGGLLLAAPQARVQRVLTLVWEDSGSGIQASVAAAAAAAIAVRIPAQRRAGPAAAPITATDLTSWPATISVTRYASPITGRQNAYGATVIARRNN